MSNQNRFLFSMKLIGDIALRDDRITDPNFAAFEDAANDATVPAHRVVTAGTENLFHSRTGVADSGTFEQHLTDTEFSVTQRKQIDT